MISGDWSPPPAALKEASTSRKSQLILVPGVSWRMVSLNTTIKPFDDLNVRRAVLAGFDRNAMRLARGGPLIGDMPTHFLPPGMNGFEEAGGMKGPGYDFMDTTGKPNLQLAAEYFKKAGYASGKYEGTEELLMVGTSEGVAQKAAEVAKENFEQLGFKVRMRLVTQDAMLNKFCTVPSAKVAICPNVAWGKDFADGQTILDPTFNGENIIPQQNSNWPQLDDKALNAEMNKAKVLSDPDGARSGLGGDRQEAHRDGAERPVGVGQAGADRLAGRQRRGLAPELDVGPGLDLAQVATGERGCAAAASRAGVSSSNSAKNPPTRSASSPMPSAANRIGW